jgi:transposase
LLKTLKDRDREASHFKGGSLMRKMQDYILKGKRIFIGLEDSKRTWKLCVCSGGMIVDETSMPTNYKNLRHYLKNRYPDCEIKLMYEAGFGGFWLYDRLMADGIFCIVTPPHKVTQEKVNKVKTDRVDARRLARNLENNDYRSCHVADREHRENRQVSRTMTQIQRNITSTKNRIRKFLDFHGLNEGLPAGSWKSTRYQNLKSLKLSTTLRSCLDIYLNLLESLDGLRSELEAHLKSISEQDRYRESVEVKQSCPGVGWLSAIRFTLEWGDLSRFPTGKHLSSYTGLTSSEYSTGERIHRGRITGQGSGMVRGWLIQCAWRAVSRDPVLLNKFERVRKNSGSKKKAIVAVARKLAIRMRAIEVLKQPYVVGVIE